MRKIILGVVLLTVMGAVGYWADRRVKYVNGYCYAEKRYVTDNEVVDVAVTQLLKNLEEEYVQMSPEQRANTVIYQGLEDFYEAQPRCCGRSRNGGKSERPPRPFPFSGNGTLRHSKTIYYRHNSKGNTPYHSIQFLIPLCGTSAVSIGSSSGKISYTGRPVNYDPNRKPSTLNDRRLEMRDLQK